MSRKAENRISVCYVAPGQTLLPSAGATRNVLSLARALGRWAEVTVAFRRLEGDPPDGVNWAEIQPRPAPGGRERTRDDSALRGIGYLEFGGYLKALRSFARDELTDFDVILEKGWFLSGWLCDMCNRRGTPGIPIENLVPVPGKGERRDALAVLRHRAGRRIAMHYLRRAPLIVAETTYLRGSLNKHFGIAEDRIRVVDVGVDPDRFRPRDRAEAREALGIDPAATIVLYVGILDRAHDMRPVVDAWCEAAPAGAELHIAGDGPLGDMLRDRAGRATRPIRFLGRIPHERIPLHIAAADLCLAPYDAAGFVDEEVGYSTLKIREYLCMGRPVATVPSGVIPTLVTDGVTGHLLDNQRSEWRRLFEGKLDREALDRMARAAADVPLPTWDDAASAYRDVIRERVGLPAEGRVPRS